MQDRKQGRVAVGSFRFPLLLVAAVVFALPLTGCASSPTSDEVHVSVAVPAVAEQAVATDTQGPVIADPVAEGRVEPYRTPAGRSPLPQPGETFDAVLGSRAWRHADMPEAPPAGTPVAWGEAVKYVGLEVTVRGTIVDTHNAGHVTFLNFERFNPRDPTPFFLVIRRAHFEQWPESPEKFFLGRTVEVTNVVNPRRGRAMMFISDPKQVRFFND